MAFFMGNSVFKEKKKKISQISLTEHKLPEKCAGFCIEQSDNSDL